LSAAALSAAVRRELAGFQALSAILAEEFTALGRGDVATLETLTARKNTVLDELQQAAQQRSQSLQMLNIDGGRQVVEAWLKAQSDTSQLRDWQQLMALAAQVKQSFEVNKVLLDGLSRHNHQTIDLLSRLLNPDLTYGADGRTSGQFGARDRGAV